MNYWFAEMTNMNIVVPLFNYIEVGHYRHSIARVFVLT